MCVRNYSQQSLVRVLKRYYRLFPSSIFPLKVTYFYYPFSTPPIHSLSLPFLPYQPYSSSSSKFSPFPHPSSFPNEKRGIFPPFPHPSSFLDEKHGHPSLMKNGEYFPPSHIPNPSLMEKLGIFSPLLTSLILP